MTKSIKFGGQVIKLIKSHSVKNIFWIEAKPILERQTKNITVLISMRNLQDGGGGGREKKSNTS